MNDLYSFVFKLPQMHILSKAGPSFSTSIKLKSFVFHEKSVLCFFICNCSVYVKLLVE